MTRNNTPPRARARTKQHRGKMIDEDEWAGTWFLSAVVVLFSYLLSALAGWLSSSPESSSKTAPSSKGASAASAYRWHCPLQDPLQPPAWMFPAAWAVVYTTRIFAAWLIYINDPFESSTATAALIVYGATTLVVEPAWSWVFVGARSPIGGAVLIVASSAGAFATLALFASVEAGRGGPALGAALLYLPGVLWLACAAFIGTSIALQQPVWCVPRNAEPCRRYLPPGSTTCDSSQTGHNTITLLL